jgi:predicted transcriptional regulator
MGIGGLFAKKKAVAKQTADTLKQENQNKDAADRREWEELQKEGLKEEEKKKQWKQVKNEERKMEKEETERKKKGGGGGRGEGRGG